MNDECARFISNPHKQFSKIVPALYQNMACAYIDKEYGAFTPFAKMIDIYTSIRFGGRYDAVRMHWDLHMEQSAPPRK